MSHRVRNLLAIASGLTALGRAHDLVRPVAGQTEAPSAATC